MIFGDLVEHILKQHESEKKLIKMKISQKECNFGCGECKLKFISEEAMKYHCSWKHSQTNESGRNECKLCYINFDVAPKRWKHVHGSIKTTLMKWKL